MLRNDGPGELERAEEITKDFYTWSSGEWAFFMVEDKHIWLGGETHVKRGLKLRRQCYMDIKEQHWFARNNICDCGLLALYMSDIAWEIYWIVLTAFVMLDGTWCQGTCRKCIGALPLYAFFSPFPFFPSSSFPFDSLILPCYFNSTFYTHDPRRLDSRLWRCSDSITLPCWGSLHRIVIHFYKSPLALCWTYI